MVRAGENQTTTLIPAAGEAPRDVAELWRCEELEADLTIVEAGGALYSAFSGFLGQGRMELLEPIGRDMLALPCPRALDHTPPGDWTLAV
jgi:D-aminopeptidase